MQFHIKTFDFMSFFLPGLFFNFLAHCIVGLREMKTPIFLYQDSSFNVVLRRRSNINLTYQELKFVTRERPVLYNVDQDPVHEEPYQNVYQEKRDGIPSEEVMHGPG